MARRIRRKTRLDWRRDPRLAALLAVVLLFLLWKGLLPHLWSTPPALPAEPTRRAYVSEVGGPVSVYRKPPGVFPPYEDKYTGESTAWAAFVCSHPACVEENGGEPVVFPKAWGPAPDGVTRPDTELLRRAMRRGFDATDAMFAGQADAQELSAAEQAAMENARQWLRYARAQQRKPATCPACGYAETRPNASDEIPYVQRHIPQD
jgi:hypothetical protein